MRCVLVCSCYLEIITRQNPWRGLGASKIISKVVQGKRPALNEETYTSLQENVVEVMKMCWQQKADERPTFAKAMYLLAETKLSKRPASTDVQRKERERRERDGGQRGGAGRGSVGRGSVGRGSVRRGSVGRGSVGRGSVGRGSVRRGSERRKSARTKSERRGSVTKRSEEKESVRTGSE